MMSLEELRQALGRPDLSDERTAALRDVLYGLADMLIDDYLTGQEAADPLKR
jgi:hypothetical protein